MATTPHPHKTSTGEIHWRVRFRLEKGTNPVGETFTTHEEALRFARLVDQVGGRTARAHRTQADLTKNQTLTTCYQRYEKLAQARVSPGTADAYKRIWTQHIEPEFGAWYIDLLTREQIEMWIGTLRNTETGASQKARQRATLKGTPLPPPEYLSTKTIKNIHGLLSSILEQEVRAGRLARNVAKGITLPRTGRKRQPVFLNTGEFAQFLQAIDPQWQTMVALIAATGLRFGEVTALTPSDVDLQTSIPVLRVTKSWSRAGRGREEILGPPKTDASIRTVSIPANLLEPLQAAMEGRGVNDLIFHNNGRQVKNVWFHENVWQPACRNSGLGKKPRIHDLRHTHASWLIMQGVPLTVIQRRLGHSSIQVTSDTYGHLAPDAWAMAAQATELAMSQALPQIEG